MATKKISVSLTNELNETIQDAVGTGAYKSSSEVVRDALRVWQAGRERDSLEMKRLKVAIRDGLNSGDSVTVGPEFFDRKREMIRKLNTTKQ